MASAVGSTDRIYGLGDTLLVVLVRVVGAAGVGDAGVGAAVEAVPVVVGVPVGPAV